MLIVRVVVVGSLISNTSLVSFCSFQLLYSLRLLTRLLHMDATRGDQAELSFDENPAGVPLIPGRFPQWAACTPAFTLQLHSPLPVHPSCFCPSLKSSATIIIVLFGRLAEGRRMRALEAALWGFLSKVLWWWSRRPTIDFQDYSADEFYLIAAPHVCSTALMLVLLAVLACVLPTVLGGLWA